MRDLELLFELRERILVAELCANVDQDQAKGRCDRNRDEDAEETVERASGQQREDHDGGMQLDDPADDQGYDEVVLRVAKNRVHRGDDRHVPDLR